MKKKICVFGMAFVLTMAALTGCGEKNQEAGKLQEPAFEQEDTTLLKDMEEINTLDSIVDRNGRVFYTVKETMADGTDGSYTLYQDKTRYVLVDEYGTLIDENGDVYGMDTEQGIPIHCLFIGDTYEGFAADDKVWTLYEHNAEEKITSKEVKDGMIYLETELPREVSEEYYSVYGFTSDDADYILSEYEIDSETKEIIELKSYVVEGEKKTLYSDVILDRECEEYIPDKEITDGVFENESRTLSVVADAGTAEEKTYTQTVAKGGGIPLYIPEEYDQKVYADAECTEEADIDRTKDQTVYLKRIEVSNGIEELNDSDESNGSDESASVDNTSAVCDSQLGYSITYDPTVFTLDESSDSDTFTYNTTEELAAPVYLSVQNYADMDAQTLAEGLALQSDMDGVEVQDTYFGADSLETKNVYIEKEVDGVKQIQIFYAIPVGEGSLLLEMGTYAGVPETVDTKFEEMLATFVLK